MVVTPVLEQVGPEALVEQAPQVVAVAVVLPAAVLVGQARVAVAPQVVARFQWARSSTAAARLRSPPRQSVVVTPVLEQVGPEALVEQAPQVVAVAVVLPAAVLVGQARVAVAPQVVARFQWARSSTAAEWREHRLNSPRQHRRSR